MSYIGGSARDACDDRDDFRPRRQPPFRPPAREVEAGKEFVVTRNGVRVARIVPEAVPDTPREPTSAQQEALAASMEWLGRGWPLGIKKIDRDELYDDARAWMRRL